MIDFNGEVVKENSFLVEAEEDCADFYEIKNGKPVMFARWDFENGLHPFSIDEARKRVEALSDDVEHVAFYKNYLLRVYDRKENMSTEYMFLVGPKVGALLDEIKAGKSKIQIDEDHICYLDLKEEISLHE